MKNAAFYLLLLSSSFLITLFAFTSIEQDKDNNTKSKTEKVVVLDEQQEKVKKLEEQIVKLEDEINSQNVELDYKKEEAAYHKQFIQEIIPYLDESELNNLTKMQWKYQLQINDADIPKNGQITVKKGTVKVSLFEQQPIFKSLPDDTISKGKISGEYINHLQMLTPKPSETESFDGIVWKDKYSTTGINHNYLDAKSEAQISFTITEELRERLGLDTHKVIIKVK